MIINFFGTPPEFCELWILKGGFRSIKTRGIKLCLPRSGPILCIILSQNLQAYTNEQGGLAYKKIEEDCGELRPPANVLCFFVHWLTKLMAVISSWCILKVRKSTPGLPLDGI